MYMEALFCLHQTLFLVFVVFISCYVSVYSNANLSALTVFSWTGVSGYESNLIFDNFGIWWKHAHKNLVIHVPVHMM